MKAKNKIKMFAIIALVALVAVGSTLAYLSSVTDTKENKFTSSKGLTGEITETEWFEEGKQWDDYLPGQSHGKNPVISIDDKGVDAYVAMKVDITGNDGERLTLAEFQEKYAKVSYKNADDTYTDGINPAWRADKENDGFYFYDSILPTGKATTAIFDKVTINTGIYRVYSSKTQTEKLITYKVDEQGKEIPGSRVEGTGQILASEDAKIYVEKDGELVEVTDVDSNLPTFQINVTGYAVQASTETADTYEDLLRGLAGL